MVTKYSDKEREKKRKIFAKNRKAECSIAFSCEVAGISPSTYYSWNKGDSWSKDDGWSKDAADSKDDGYSK